MTSNSVTLHKVVKAQPEKVFRAFTDPNALASWIPPYGFLCVISSMDVKVGGSFKMKFINFTTGKGDSFGGKYLDVKPNELLKYSEKFDNPNLPGELTTTVRLKKLACGTEINIVQEGIPVMIPVEMCYLGWQESLDKLARLVEPEIPDG
jgi:uncharacterized protein YndB with AHSA1/START domain